MRKAVDRLERTTMNDPLYMSYHVLPLLSHIRLRQSPWRCVQNIKVAEAIFDLEVDGAFT